MAVAFVSSRIIKIEIFLPDASCVARLRKTFDKEFQPPAGLHCGKGSRGGYSIISSNEAYVMLEIEEKDESRLLGFIRDFLENESIEFSVIDY